MEQFVDGLENEPLHRRVEVLQDETVAKRRDLERLVHDLEAQFAALHERKQHLWQKLDQAKEALHNVCAITEEQKVTYTIKLNDMRNYISLRMKNEGPAAWPRIAFTVRKLSTPYRNDFGTIVADPLDIAIAEYNLLDMGSHFDVRIDVHQDAVERFAMEWMQTNMPGSMHETNLFAFN